MILSPISVGELIDKITILEIKFEKIKDKDKLKNIAKELKILNILCQENKIWDKETTKLKQSLKEINYKLWDIEDKIREKENLKQFDDEFIQIARSVYINNDIRCKIKKQINLLLNSELVEEKSYKEN